MTVKRNSHPLPLTLSWEATRRPLPTHWVIPEGRRRPIRPAFTAGHDFGPLDFCGRMRRVCEDIVGRCETFRHVRMPAVLTSFTPSRNRSLFGLQARVTPLRFRDGRLIRRQGPVEYQ